VPCLVEVETQIGFENLAEIVVKAEPMQPDRGSLRLPISNRT
jgi:hypothetical protein